jgi:hypothetical protein
MNFKVVVGRKDLSTDHNAAMPENFTQMKSFAERIARHVDAKFVRVDLYSIKGNIYFSEITFTPCSGFLPFEPASADEELGKLLKLPIEK